MKKLICWGCLIAALMLTSCIGNEEAYQYKTDYLPVQLVGSEKWSIIDVNSGELVVKDAFDHVPSPVVDGMFWVMNDDGSYDYYDVSDATHPAHGHYGSVTCYSDDGVAVCSRVGGPLCVIDRKGNVIKQLPKEISQCSMFSRGMAMVQADSGLWGYIDARGDTVVPAIYQSANMFMYSDYAIVVSDEQPSDTALTFTVIDKSGKVMYSASSSQYSPLRTYYLDGVLPVVKGDSVVCLNAQGDEVEGPASDSEQVTAGGYSDYARTPHSDYIVTRGGKTGMVDKAGKLLIAIEHDHLIDINGERLIAVDSLTSHIVDRTGKPVGDVKFGNAHLAEDTPFATRGFIDTDLAAASMMMLFDETGACGATAHTTLMDMNAMLGTDARQYAGSNTLIMPQGPFIIQFVFDRDVATMNADSTAASFNYDARVNRVMMTLDLKHCPPSTEEAIVKKVENRLGTKGFVYARDGIFCSDYLTAMTMGYDKGVLNTIYYMHFNESTPQSRNRRR